MAIQVECSSCKASYSVPDARAGQTGRCKCGQLMAVPAPQAEPPPPQTPGAAPTPTEVPLPPVIEDAETAPQGQVRCPHCGMESRPGPTCEWCNKDLPGAAQPGAAAAAAEHPATVPTGAVIHRLEPASCLRAVGALAVAYSLVIQVPGYIMRLVSDPREGLGLSYGRLAGSGVMMLLTLVVALVFMWVMVGAFNLVARWLRGFPIRFQKPAHWRAGARELTRVVPLSGLLVGALGGFAAGLLGAAMSACASAMLAGALPGGLGSSDVSEMAMVLVALPFVSAGMGAALTALFSFVYNLVARAWGGVTFATGPPQGVAEEAEGAARGAGGEAVRIQGIDVLQWGLVCAHALPVIFLICKVVSIVLLGPLALLFGGLSELFDIVGLVKELVGCVILGFISGIVSAAIYNLIGLIMGGLEVETSG